MSDEVVLVSGALAAGAGSNTSSSQNIQSTRKQDSVNRKSARASDDGSAAASIDKNKKITEWFDENQTSENTDNEKRLESNTDKKDSNVIEEQKLSVVTDAIDGVTNDDYMDEFEKIIFCHKFLTTKSSTDLKNRVSLQRMM